MKIVMSTQVDVQQWDSLATAMDGGYYHCHAPAVAEAIRMECAPIFVKALGGEGQCVGLTTGRLVTPFGWPFSRYCRSATLFALPAMAEKSVEGERAFMEALEAHLRSEGVYVVNIYSYDSPHAQQVLSSLGYELSARTEFYVDLARDEEKIWDGLRSERRTNIRKARKHNVQTRIENTEAAIDQVFAFFEQSMQRHDIDFGEIPERLRRARRERLKNGHIDVFVSYQNEKPVNGAIFGNFNGRPYYVMSGASPQGYKVCGPAHLIWTAITTYHERGATCLNLGAALENDATYRFKRDFGATLVSQPSGLKNLSTFGARLHQTRALLRHKRS